MDGLGRARDKVFVKRVWCSVKHEDVYLHSNQTVPELYRSLIRYSGTTTHSADTGTSVATPAQRSPEPGRTQSQDSDRGVRALCHSAKAQVHFSRLTAFRPQDGPGGPGYETQDTPWRSFAGVLR